MYVKKNNNNKFRNGSNNNNTNQYSLTYKFDSASIAGKISGNALDLIRRYNDMAKEAYSNHDSVSAEVFKQYAEHYRKIVTDINERKNNKQQQSNKKEAVQEKSQETAVVEAVAEVAPVVVAETAEAPAPVKKRTLRKKLVVVNAEEK
ncbi:MAG: DUF4167 domain-containing protein [Alphaproteobacteria bacterium]